jgi:hypothetical protein
MARTTVDGPQPRGEQRLPDDRRQQHGADAVPAVPEQGAAQFVGREQEDQAPQDPDARHQAGEGDRHHVPLPGGERAAAPGDLGSAKLIGGHGEHAGHAQQHERAAHRADRRHRGDRAQQQQRALHGALLDAEVGDVVAGEVAVLRSQARAAAGRGTERDWTIPRSAASSRAPPQASTSTSTVPSPETSSSAPPRRTA